LKEKKIKNRYNKFEKKSKDNILNCALNQIITLYQKQRVENKEIIALLLQSIFVKCSISIQWKKITDI
jgi:hypothetical protein